MYDVGCTMYLYVICDSNVELKKSSSMEQASK